ncbi:GRAM domain-containing protein [Nonlabens xiamenensis]|uniref:GRAM domain-containing protein n=1 Tax=Nonlabens xiamenensis TaxID=2341043 RepID=UPI000F60F8BE|nr:GRAM domain-containing protein [Nonlabens xiamenensis]
MQKFFTREFWLTAGIFGISMFIIMCVFVTLSDGFSWSMIIIMAIAHIGIAGPLFAAMMVIFARYSFKKISIEIPPGEEVLGEYGANLKRSAEAVGGKVALTDKHLIFQSHQLNIQSGPQIIALADITHTTTKNSFFGWVQNIVEVHTKEAVFTFNIQNRSDFLTQLDAQQQQSTLE